MPTAISPDALPEHDIQIEVLVQQWYTAIAPWNVSTSMQPGIHQRLTELARQSHALLFAADLRPEQARPLGAALVEMQYHQPEVLEQTLLVLEQHLRSWWSVPDQAGLNERLAALLAGIAAGFVWKTRQVILIDRERMLELERSNAELKRFNPVHDDFLIKMSHDLWTPLHAILILSESLRSDIYGELSAIQVHRLQQIEQSTHHLKTMLSDILDLTRIGAGKMELDVKPINLNEVCLMALNLVEQAARANQIELTVSFDPEVATILTDARRLKQILLNLLDNAIKFTNPGGTIGVQIIGDKALQTVECIVWDTGIGIAEEDLPGLFQPFVQSNSNLAYKHDGSGLGLVLVSRLTELLGGHVEVMSEPECGSRFSVFLPWKTVASPIKAEAQDISSSPHRTGSQQISIVLAEDELINAALLCDFLGMRGYQVVTARNGFEAIEQTRKTRPDIVVMDIQMPDMDGLEAIQQIRSLPDLAHIPIIAMTAMATNGDEERCIEVGANEYLSKPVSLHKLAEMINTLCLTSGA